MSIRLSVRPSLCPSLGHSRKPAAVGLLLWARRAGDIDRLLQQRPVNAGSATLSVGVRIYTFLLVITVVLNLTVSNSTTVLAGPTVTVEL